MGRWLGKILAGRGGGGAAPTGWFAAPAGNPSGAGTVGDPWDLQTAMFGGVGGTFAAPATTVQPGDTVWLRAGTYTHAYQSAQGGNFVASLTGTAGNPITFRGYPGERATIDGNYDPSETGHNGAVVDLRDYFGARGYMILRDLEIMNSRVGRAGTIDTQHDRNDGFFITAPHSKIINCIIHDNGEGGFPSSVGGWEVNGNLVYYNGEWDPFAEQNEAVSVDLIPAGGVAVATSGTYHIQESGATSITITGHINAGDYTLVAVNKNGLGYAVITATFDGAAMTLLTGVDGYSKSVAMFGIKGHTTTANVVVNSNDAYVVRAIAQSFVNVNQNASEILNAVPGTFTVADGAMSISSHTLTSATGGFTANHVGQPIEVAGAGAAGATLKTYVQTYTNTNTLQLVATSYANVSAEAVLIRGGTWWNNQWNDGPTRGDGSQGGAIATPYISYSISTPANTNHMVVDGIGIYDSYSKNVAPSGDNTGNLIGPATPGSFGGNPIVRMSTATRTGAGTVAMGWTWTMTMLGHGHGSYIQSGVSDSVVAVASNATLTWNGSPSSNGPFRANQAGGNIRVTGAGIAGADLVTVIDTYTDNGTVVLHVAPSTSVNPTEATWGWPTKYKDNILLDQVVESIQVYGSSGAAGGQLTLEGNFHFNNSVTLGGLSGFRLTDSVYKNNYTWSNAVGIGYHMNDLTNFSVQNNYIDNSTNMDVTSPAWDNFTMTGNTFVGAIAGFTSGDFPTNTYTYVGSNPTVNVIAVRPNDYETNRANIFVYNWQNLATVAVDLTGIVTPGTPINIMNAQDYYGTRVYTGTYGGGTVTLPMTGLTVAAAIGGVGGDTDATFVPQASTAPAFAAFIVRAQSTETWR
jgi:hypothetical protein